MRDAAPRERRRHLIGEHHMRRRQRARGRREILRHPVVELFLEILVIVDRRRRRHGVSRRCASASWCRALRVQAWPRGSGGDGSANDDRIPGRRQRDGTDLDQRGIEDLPVHAIRPAARTRAAARDRTPG